MPRNLTRDGLLLGAALLIVAAMTLRAVLESGASLRGTQLEPFCEPGQAPVFSLGFKALADRLGERMGQPLECEHGDPLTGDTHQKTTTGMATYHVCTNTPVFRRDRDVWALTPSGVLHWDGRGEDPTLGLPRAIQGDLRRPCGQPAQ
jgi:hypothetical protein